MHANNKRTGFTLIELLVVIAIIAILAAILFPVFAQARESARTTSCLSNEKQISLGLLQYVQDFDEKFPNFQFGDPWDSGYGKTDPDGAGYVLHEMTWDKAVAPYIKNRGVFQCPDEYGPGNDWTNPAKDTSDWTGTINYATNCRLVGGDWGQWASPAKLSALSYPASTIMIRETGTQASAGACGDDNTNGEWGWTGDQAQDLTAQYATNTQPAPLAAHKGGANYAFTDGHAKWYNSTTFGVRTQAGCPYGLTQCATDATVQQIMNNSGTVPTFHLNTSF